MSLYIPPFYFHTVSDVPGTVAAKSFLTIFNPPASTLAVVFFSVEISVYSVGATGGTDSLFARRITAVSGGTQLDPNAVNRLNTTNPNPVAEVYVDNPSITTDPVFTHGLASWPPPQTTGVGGGTTTTSTAPGPGFVCLPGQGVTFRTEAGTTNQRWKVLANWAEASG